MCRRTVGPKALAQYTARASAMLSGYAGPYRITKTPTEPTLATQVCAWRGRKGEPPNFLELRLAELRRILLLRTTVNSLLIVRNLRRAGLDHGERSGVVVFVEAVYHRDHDGVLPRLQPREQEGRGHVNKLLVTRL